MKCENCGSEWSAPPEVAAQMKVCPFCSAPLVQPAAKTPETMAEALQLVVSIYGADVLEDGSRLLACFSDTVPQLARQKRMLSNFIECQGHSRLAAVKQDSADKQYACVEQIVMQMTDELCLDESASRDVCESFLAVLTGRKPEPAQQPVPVQQIQEMKAPGSSSGDGVESPQQCRSAAEQGDADAQYRLGIYLENVGSPESKTEARQWYLKAAEQGLGEAQCSLARCMENGIGGPVNKAEAVQWYQKAAEQGDAEGQFQLGRCLEKGVGCPASKPEAVKWYRRAAEQGHAVALYTMGNCLKRGIGVAKSRSEAFDWYRAAAEAGHARAQYILGDHLYYRSKYAEAVQWYRKAAEQGDSEAQYWLAYCLEHGTGTTMDKTEALDWYRRAADQGEFLAQHRVRKLLQS